MTTSVAATEFEEWTSSLRQSAERLQGLYTHMHKSHNTSLSTAKFIHPFNRSHTPTSPLKPQLCWILIYSQSRSQKSLWWYSRHSRISLISRVYTRATQHVAVNMFLVSATRSTCIPLYPSTDGRQTPWQHCCSSVNAALCFYIAESQKLTTWRSSCSVAQLTTFSSYTNRYSSNKSYYYYYYWDQNELPIMCQKSNQLCTRIYPINTKAVRLIHCTAFQSTQPITIISNK